MWACLPYWDCKHDYDTAQNTSHIQSYTAAVQYCTNSSSRLHVCNYHSSLVSLTFRHTDTTGIWYIWIPVLYAWWYSIQYLVDSEHWGSKNRMLAHTTIVLTPNFSSLWIMEFFKPNRWNANLLSEFIWMNFEWNNIFNAELTRNSSR